VSIDLHTHSTASDGTDSPAELVANARAAGLNVVALTDHDTTYGWAEAADALPAGLQLVRGAELSCSAGGISLHLLAYLFDPAHKALTGEVQRAFDDRLGRARKITDRLTAAGYPLTWEAVLAEVGEGAAVGRPHIADALVTARVVPDRETAFAELLHNRSPFYVRHYALDPIEAVRLVRAAGGVPVFAHPAASARGRTVADDVIVAMASAGLAGLEVNHRDHTEAARAHLRILARELGLLVTGSSDYHGAGKDNRLGENTTDPDVLEALLAQARGVEVLAA
jgi:predicted metal-dependent phosphoesterase TrpH